MLLESPFINGISLKNNSLENEGVNKIISTIGQENSNLISLDLSDTKIDEKAMKIISEKINGNIALQKLNLYLFVILIINLILFSKVYQKIKI